MRKGGGGEGGRSMGRDCGACSLQRIHRLQDRVSPEGMLSADV
jgi:hypothetical protein